MNEQAKQPLEITLGDQTFRVRVAPGERERYLRIAKAVNDSLEDVMAQGVMGSPRALAMALFQTAMELDEARETMRRAQTGRDRLGSLIDRIDQALDSDGGKS